MVERETKVLVPQGKRLAKSSNNRFTLYKSKMEEAKAERQIFYNEAMQQRHSSVGNNKKILNQHKAYGQPGHMLNFSPPKYTDKIRVNQTLNNHLIEQNMRRTSLGKGVDAQSSPLSGSFRNAYNLTRNSTLHVNDHTMNSTQRGITEYHGQLLEKYIY